MNAYERNITATIATTLLYLTYYGLCLHVSLRPQALIDRAPWRRLDLRCVIPGLRVGNLDKI